MKKRNILLFIFIIIFASRIFIQNFQSLNRRNTNFYYPFIVINLYLEFCSFPNFLIKEIIKSKTSDRNNKKNSKKINFSEIFLVSSVFFLVFKEIFFGVKKKLIYKDYFFDRVFYKTEDYLKKYLKKILILIFLSLTGINTKIKIFIFSPNIPVSGLFGIFYFKGYK